MTTKGIEPSNDTSDTEAKSMTEQMSKQIALERIENAFRFRETELNLSGWGLEELPLEIGRLVWLEKLDLESAGIHFLPKEIGLLKNLKELNLFDNRLETLPKEIGELTSLEHLDLNFNHITQLPSEFGRLENLTHLEYGDCNLGYFPFVITKLRNLQVLYMDYGGFEYLPAEIGNLTELEVLDLNANLLSSLPFEFGYLNKLKILDISRNDFRELPESLFSLKNLEELYAGENYLTIINPRISNLGQLKVLNLGNSGEGFRYSSGETDYQNEILELPREFAQLKNLHILDLTGNPLPIPPEILYGVNDPTSILKAYFKDQPEMTNRNLKVFLCHSSNDKPQVRKLYRKLMDDDIDVWLDEKNLLPGQDWEFEISTAVAHSDAIIICLSKNSVSKEGFIQKEIRFALEKAEEKPEGTIFIIPALLENCEVPQKFSKRHHVKLFERNGYTQLLKALIVRAKNLGLV
jgi:Leucine-rich repeat (LRR) protein